VIYFLTCAVRYFITTRFTDPHDSEIWTLRCSDSIRRSHPDPLCDFSDLPSFVGTAYASARKFLQISEYPGSELNLRIPLNPGKDDKPEKETLKSGLLC
jgi:hypothetical protein